MMGLSSKDITQSLIFCPYIIPVLQSTPPTTFTYYPQLSLPFQDVKGRAENVLTVKYPIDNPHSNNKYVWIKNGVKLDSSTSPLFTFNPLTYSDSGNYSLKVYNTSAPFLTLSSDTFKISVIPCIEFHLPSVSILSKECGKGYTIDLSNAQIAGGTSPFIYELNNDIQSKKHIDKIIENVEAGNYKITIIDSKNCTASDNLVLNQPDECDPVITPNGDGIADNYFIDKPGKVKIYDLKRKLVNTLKTPAIWDGTDQNGALLDAGYNILIMDDTNPIYISIIR